MRESQVFESTTENRTHAKRKCCAIILAIRLRVCSVPHRVSRRVQHKVNALGFDHTFRAKPLLCEYVLLVNCPLLRFGDNKENVYSGSLNVVEIIVGIYLRHKDSLHKIGATHRKAAKSKENIEKVFEVSQSRHVECSRCGDCCVSGMEGHAKNG